MSNADKWSAEEARQYFAKDKPKQKGRAHVQGTKSSTDAKGVKHKSELQRFCYFMLDQAGIKFEYEKPIELVPAIKYRGKNIKPMRIEVDFYLTELDVFIDPKGYNKFKGAARERSRIKYKYLMHKLKQSGKEPAIYYPTTKGEVLELINKLKK